ncbi:uncharacterized protein LOC144887761 [Branchiostoma floridae x Branchiostoma japonicum]
MAYFCEKFIIRYGTHFIKSAKFGGSFRVFKTQEASKTQSLTEFSVQAQASYSGMFSAGASFGTKGSSESAQSSKTASTRVTAEGGHQEVAAVVADFYTTGFKDTFSQWLKTIPAYPKPVEMFMGTITELLNLNFKLMFPFDVKDVAKGCFSGGLKTESETGKKYYETSKLVNDTDGVMQTIKEKRYCEFTEAEKFQEAMDRKRLALERATTVYMEEGPVPANDFSLEGGPPGCQSDDLLLNGVKAGVAHPPWQELIDGNKYKIIFDLPQDIGENIKKTAAAFLVFANDRWNCHLPGTRVHAFNSHFNGGSGDTKNKRVSCFGFVMTYNEVTGQFSVTAENLEASKKSLGELTGLKTNTIVGRAEYVSLLEHSRQDSEALASIVQAPCSVKWSNSYQIDPKVETGQCLYFVGISAGDIFVVFSAIPKIQRTWFHLQIGLKGVALYKGMKLVKYEGAKAARGLGASNLFQPYFICIDEESTRTFIKYGIGSDQSEKGKAYLVYNDYNPPLGIRYYSFGSGEASVEIMDARVIEGSEAGSKECIGGTKLEDGKCVQDCHPECDGCIPQTPGSKLDTECRRCKHFTIDMGDGCPKFLNINTANKSCSCPANSKMSPDRKSCICNIIEVDHEGKTICVSKCPDLKKPNLESPPTCVCKLSRNGVCVKKCPPNAVQQGDKCSTNCQMGRGASYRGTVSVTKSGIPCQSWGIQFPHQHSTTPSKFPEAGLVGAFCRNPNGAVGVFCYTRDPRKEQELCDVPQCECQTEDGFLYRGKVAETETGKTCQRWDSQTPHKHSLTQDDQRLFGLDNNYCRNPNGDKKKVWCYTTDPNKEWEHCAVPECEEGPPGSGSSNGGKTCLEGKGKSYRGYVAVTKSGLACQRWDSQTPHRHSFTPEDLPDSGLEENYCRNPMESQPGPWCITTDPTKPRDLCTIPACQEGSPGSGSSNDRKTCLEGKGESYRGYVAVTKGGWACQRWDSQIPHRHELTPEKFPDAGLEENYCRKPIDHSDITGPFCMTTDPNKPWDHCSIPPCTCKEGNGASYRGHKAVTKSGKTCQRWDSQTPHKHTITTAKYPSSGLEENFCRNPSSSSGPWCYTTDPKERWELCDIPDC